MNRRIPGHAVVKFEYSRHIRPKFVHGGVRLRFDSVRPYSLESQRPVAGYNAQVRAAVEYALLERCGALDKCQVVLEGNEVDSCATGFEKAARAATEMASVVQRW